MKVTASEPNGYRSFLAEAFSRRCSSNPSYSLRAFARDLEMTAAQLSFVLNGKRNLSLEKAKSIANKIALSPEKANLFCALVSLETARGATSKELAKSKLEAIQQDQDQSYSLNLDSFRVISDWYNFALLQLMRLKRYREDERWIAKELGINPNEVGPALDRLKRLELCEWNAKTKKHQALEEMFFAPNGVPSDAIRKFHRQCLEKALAAIENQNLEERFLSTSILPISKRDMPEAKKTVQSFHKRFMKKFENREPLDEVVCLSVQLFKITQNQSEGELK